MFLEDYDKIHEILCDDIHRVFEDDFFSEDEKKDYMRKWCAADRAVAKLVPDEEFEAAEVEN